MKVLVIGSGGREHALIWKLKQSPHVKEIFCAPGNGGISGMVKCMDIKPEDVHGLLQFALKEMVDLTVVGPEVALVAGIVDEFEKVGLRIFGPSKQAAQLEGSKVFAKEFMHRHGIPTANFKTFNNFSEAKQFLAKIRYPAVIKADGLAAGKGVVVCQNLEEADRALDEIMVEKIYEEAGNQVVIEEFLKGEEVSILAVSDGKYFQILETSQDHKRIFDGDIGPNTGGMGAYSPAPIVSVDYLQTIATSVIAPAIRGMELEGNVFRGILYAGLMITETGINVLEFNVRFGDPETQAIIPRLKTDLMDIIFASLEGSLDKIKIAWDTRACVCVVMSSRGYPKSYEKGKEISGLDAAAVDRDTIVFHAGTEKKDKKIFTSSGRVLGVTSLGSDIESAIEKVYNSVEKIKFDGCFFRRDIGAKALKGMSATRR